MAREQRQFNTTGGNVIVLHTYLSGRETDEIKDIMMSTLTLKLEDMASKKMDMSGISGSVLAKQQRKLLDFLIVSVNGDEKDPVEKLLDLPSSEYEEVVAEVEKIKDPTKLEK